MKQLLRDVNRFKQTSEKTSAVNELYYLFVGCV